MYKRLILLVLLSTVLSTVVWGQCGRLAFNPITGAVDCIGPAAAGTGTVTSVSTTGPISGGPITTSGTISCPTCGVTGSPLSQFAATTSAQLAGVLSNETGSGLVVFNTAPSISAITLTDIATGTQCLHANSAGLVTGTGSDCGSGGGIPTGNSGGIPYYNTTTTVLSSPTWTVNTIAKGGGAAASPIITGVTIDSSNNIFAHGVDSTTGYSTNGGSTVLSIGLTIVGSAAMQWTGQGAIISPSAGEFKFVDNGGTTPANLTVHDFTLTGTCTGCPGGGSGTVSSSSVNNLAVYTGSTTVGGTSGLTWDPAHPGLSLSLFNPLQGNDTNERRGAYFNFVTDGTTNNPNYSNQDGLWINMVALNGQATNGSTVAKTTFIPLKINFKSNASGQRVLLNEQETCLGMSDCTLETKTITYAGGPVNGDEGQAFQDVSFLRQQQQLIKAPITAVPTRTTCNTTATQAITADIAAQSITVASSTNCNIGDWVVIGQEVPSGSPILEAVKITASSAGHISGVFRYNHLTSVTITPATILTFTDTSNFGQDRLLVNLTASAYTTGTVSSVSGANFIGSGTTWATNMVGGSSLAIGCAALTNDDYTSAPFTGGSGPLKAWYEITAVNSTTSIGIFSFSVTGDGNYHGNGVGAGAYTIRPCARILTIENSNGVFTGNVILENNSFTWTVSDSIENAICPYPDVSGYLYQVQNYSPGGIRRSFMRIANTGARTWTRGFELVGNELQTGGGADTVGWGTGYYVDSANTGFQIDEAQAGIAFLANATATTATTKRPGYWLRAQGGNYGGFFIDYDTLQIQMGSNGDPTSYLGSFGFDASNTHLRDNKAPLTAVGDLTIDGSRLGSTAARLIITGPNGSGLFDVNSASAARTYTFPDFGGIVGVGALTTTGAASGKTVVCVDVATGKLYPSTSGVACAN